MNSFVPASLLALFSLNLSLFSQAQVALGSCITEKQADKVSGAEISLFTVSGGTEEVPTLAIGAKWLDELYSVECQGNGFSTKVDVDLESTLGDNNAFGGATVLLRGYHTRFPTHMVLVPDIGQLPLRDTSKLQHMFVLSGGIQTDAKLQNISLLAEAGYIPLYTDYSAFNLGPEVPDASWLDVGAFVQIGYTASTGLESAAAPAQAGEETADPSGALFRLKLGGRSGLRVPVTLVKVQALRLQSEAWVWYEVLDNRVYGLLEGTLSIDVTKDVAYNVFKIEHGGAPPTFAPGTQFSTGLTIQF